MKEFTFRGKKLEEIKKMSSSDFLSLIPSRNRRSLTRGLTDAQKKLLEKVKKANTGAFKKPIKTHCKDMIVTPEMLDLMISVHNGRSFITIKIIPEMLGHYLGEFVVTRQKVKHSAPGIGATKSSAAVSVK